MQSVVLATDNPGKVRELQTLLTALAVEILPQSAVGAVREPPLRVEILPQSAFQVPEIEETGSSFVENALLKARNAAYYSGLPAIADDSGLVVDALHGAPGIYSARYAGPGAADRDNMEKLLNELRAVPAAGRSARFYCALVYLRHAADPMPLICEGVWEGVIAQEPKGTGGFGYDPVFFVPSEGKTAAELEPAVKNRLSHRGQALSELRRRLER